jgi:hypothetical protein
MPRREARVKATSLLAATCVLLLYGCSNEEATRAKIAEAAKTGRQASEAVGTYARKHGRFPNQIEEAFIRPAALHDIKLLSVDSKTGRVQVALAFKPVEGKSLVFVPSRNKDRSYTWRCTSQDIDPKLLPEACR